MTRRFDGDTRAAVADTLPVGAGMFPLGIAFGVLVTQAGFAWWWTPLISGPLFAGSVEFLLLSLMTAGAPLATIALTTLLVNSRHVFYCLTFPLHRVQGRLGRLYARFALIDEAYALTISPEAQRYSGRPFSRCRSSCTPTGLAAGSSARCWARCCPRHCGGLEFALVGLFVVLAVDACCAGRDLVGGLVAVTCALVAAAVAPGQMLLFAMSLFVGVLALMARTPVLKLRTDASRAGQRLRGHRGEQDRAQLVGTTSWAPSCRSLSRPPKPAARGCKGSRETR